MFKKPQKALICISLALSLFAGCSQSTDNSSKTPEDKFQPTWESISKHKVPRWFDDAKFGIFIHWGLYSVPAWATPEGELGNVDFSVWFNNNPYAEWYLNSLRIPGSPTQAYHFKTYGKDFDYYNFAPQFNEAVKKWDPNQMAEIFQRVGARYVVLTTKHHDGFTLWPSELKNPHLPIDRQCSSRDLVGELTSAVRNQGMRMGLYYSGGLDWSFNPKPVTVLEDVWGSVIHTENYAKYADAHWRELIDRYEPSVLWNDIGYPKQGDLLHIFAEYYNRFPDGLVNNRWATSAPDDLIDNLTDTEPGTEADSHHDFLTPEYSKMDHITDYKWETCRGLGFSFGFNQNEGPEQTIKEEELIHLLVDVVSKNGNLLLNVGPKADGTIPSIQLSRLHALGRWLSVNGEAIYGTRPWERAEGETSEGTDVRFTRQGNSVYAILFAKPIGKQVIIKTMSVPTGARISMLGDSKALEYSTSEGNLIVTLPSDIPVAHAYTLKIDMPD